MDEEKKIVKYPLPNGNVAFEEEGAFDHGIKFLAQHKAAFSSCPEFAGARIGLGLKHHLNSNGYWVAESMNYLSNGDILVSKILQNQIIPEIATDCHRNGKEFYLEKRVWEQLQDLAKRNPADALSSGVLLLKRREVKPIDTSRPYDNKLGIFLFEKQLRPYCAFCKEAEISQIPVEVAEKKKRAFARQLYIYYLAYMKSCILGNDFSLYDGRVLGEREAAGKV
jgi:hypothetical protein